MNEWLVKKDCCQRDNEIAREGMETDADDSENKISTTGELGRSLYPISSPLFLAFAIVWVLNSGNIIINPLKGELVHNN